MRSNYKRLGDYIRLVDERNRNLEVKDLIGLTINKVFIPSVANTVGTDMSKYKIIRKNQFACSIMQVRRDKKMPVALWKSEEPAIISQAYPVFEIIEEGLLPEYLMMWFTRKEFDRQACFLAVGGVRGSLEWNDFIDLELPIPSIEKQKELVAEYQTIENRIRLNNELCQKLEDTAQTLYRHWFEDFEFPVIARSEAQQNDEAISTNHILQVAEHTAEYQNRSELVAERSRSVAERSRSYKSSGGKMVYNEELGKEIPEGWSVGNVKSFCAEMKNGATPSRDNLDYWFPKEIPWLKTGEISNNIIFNAEEYISKEGFERSSTKLLPVNSVLMAMYGATAAQLGFLKFEASTNQACCAMICDSYQKSCFLYFNLLNRQSAIKGLANGGAQENISKNIIEKLLIVIPPNDILENCGLDIIINKLEKLTKQTQKLEELQSLLLGKMAVEEK